RARVAGDVLDQSSNGIRFRIEHCQKIHVFKLSHGSFAHALVAAELALDFFEVVGCEVSHRSPIAEVRGQIAEVRALAFGSSFSAGGLTSAIRPLTSDLELYVASHAEPIVRVLELRRDARARRSPISGPRGLHSGDAA